MFAFFLFLVGGALGAFIGAAYALSRTDPRLAVEHGGAAIRATADGLPVPRGSGFAVTGAQEIELETVLGERISLRLGLAVGGEPVGDQANFPPSRPRPSVSNFRTSSPGK